jgi:hypothetical protein
MNCALYLGAGDSENLCAARLGGYFFAAVELLLKQVSLNGSGTFCGSFGAGDGAGVGCGTAGFGMASGMSSGCEPG